MLPVHAAELQIERIAGHTRLDYQSLSARELPSLLADQPITVHTLVSLENLRHCLRKPESSCESLRSLANDWLQAAADNPRTLRQYRAIIARNAAELRAEVGDFESALRYISRAVEHSPEFLAYRLAQVEYMIRSGRSGHAAELLAALESRFPPLGRQRATNRESIAALHRMLESTGSGRAAVSTR
jgi:hypothetical protein